MPKDLSELKSHNKCGWSEKKYHYFSWALSARQLLKFYDKVELVTDKNGYNLLINKLELPYTKVDVVLDDLNDYDSKLWALGKIYAYRMQNEPFLHVDGDIFIWERFQKSLEDSNLICQSKEEGTYFEPLYKNIFLPIALNFEYYPEELDRAIDKDKSVRAICAGIIGGNDINFFQYYTAKAFEFVDRNTKHLDKTNSTFNLIFEQFLFRALAEDQNIPISFFDDSTAPTYYYDFTGVPNSTKYIHLGGNTKRNKFLAECMAYRLRKDYPTDYYRIIGLLKKNQI